MTEEARSILPVAAELGEGPVWVPRDQALWFVDIAGRSVHRFHPDSGQHTTWAAPDKATFVLPLDTGGHVVGLNGALTHFNAANGEFRHLMDVEPERDENRLNDACVSPQGELWFGSMHDPECELTGSLYRLCSQGRLYTMDQGYVVTNGPAFSPDGRTFYHTDTLSRVVYAFDCSADGALSGKRVLVKIEANAGFPDGTCTDAEGCLWIALWAGWEARRYSPAGVLLERVRFPCANITKLAFGGVDHQTLFATTAWRGMSAVERCAQPCAGDLFSFHTETPGLAPVPLRLRTTQAARPYAARRNS